MTIKKPLRLLRVFVAAMLAVALAFPVALASTVALAAESNDSTADHSKFEELHREFATGPDVTKACLDCHTEASAQVQEGIHWTWEYKHPETGQVLGKKHVVNSFCGNIVTNEPRCTSCHAGYGWEERDFDFTDETKVDCLVCHDTTGTYEKFPAGAGHPVYEPTRAAGRLWTPPDLAEVARNVGLPGRENCGSCHFYGGGGDGVKHGDLDSSLVEPSRELDVHMSPDGQNFACTECHRGSGHQWAGSRYLTMAVDPEGTGLPGERREAATCESCHGLAPHDDTTLTAVKLNDHVDTVACQSCHIPHFARGGVPTKMVWDWSTAGRLDEDGNPIAEYDEHGHPTYLSEKGNFVYGENVEPEYFWFDGVMNYTLVGDKIDPSKPVEINHFDGAYGDGKSRIWPFKVMRGKQPYDTVNNTLVFNHVFGRDETALWTNYDWPAAIKAGMEEAGQPYSGEFGFIDTRMYWLTTHMVAPAEEALSCDSCHARDGRLANLAGFYMPGRDHSPLLDRIGYAVVVLALAGVLGHGALRFFLAIRRRRP